MKDQVFQHFQISRKESVFTNILFDHPTEIFAIDRPGLAAHPSTEKEAKGYFAIRRPMFPFAEQPFRKDPDRQFFKNLPLQTRFDRFALFTLAARKFPITPETIRQMTLGDQEFPMLVYNCTSNLEVLHSTSFPFYALSFKEPEAPIHKTPPSLDNPRIF